MPESLTRVLFVLAGLLPAALLAQQEAGSAPPIAGQHQLNLDLTAQDFDEQRISGFVQVSQQYKDALDTCRRNFDMDVLFADPWDDDAFDSDVLTMDLCVSRIVVEAQENFIRSNPVRVTLTGPDSGMMEIGFTLAGTTADGVTLPLAMSVYRQQDLGGTGSDGYRFGSAYREVVVSPPQEHHWNVDTEWLPGLDYDREAMDSMFEVVESIEEVTPLHEVNDDQEAVLREAFDSASYSLNLLIQLAETDFSTIELIAVARRLDMDCVMSATVSGDVNRVAFGDVAYFNTTQNPVKPGMMVGTIGDEAMHQQVAGIGEVDIASSAAGALDLAAELGLMDDDEIAEARESVAQASQEQDRNAGVPGESFEDFLNEELRAEDPTTGDNFGLNLADLKRDITPKNDQLAGAMFSGAFTLTLSGRLNISEFDVGPAQGHQPRTIEVRPSTITATVGVGDRDGDRIPFELPEDGEVAGEIMISRQNEDFIWGRIGAELETKGVYNLEGVVRHGDGVVARDKPRKLKIGVVTTFAARRGSLSCMQ